MCNKTVRGLDSLEVEKNAFCAELMSMIYFLHWTLIKQKQSPQLQSQNLLMVWPELPLRVNNRLKSSKKKSDHELLKHEADKQLAWV